LENNLLICYTDGGYRSSIGVGGWGFVVYTDKYQLVTQQCGGERHTTNNRMELIAAIQALTYCKQHDPHVILYTDSQYVQKGITSWIKNWKKKNYSSVKNPDLWKELDALNISMKVKWKWIKGHSGIEGNEIADALANEGMDMYKEHLDNKRKNKGKNSE
jgi:ribonuclease HI